MKIREATEQDAEPIGKILMESYKIDSIQEGIDVFMKEREKFNYLVAEDDNVIGLVTWLQHGLPKHGLAELDRIAVLPDLRGKGVGKQLFNTMLEKIKEYYEKNDSKLRKLYLMTHKSNINAQEFYKKLGFKYEATLENHFHPGEHEYIMSIFM
ncbi:GNAT family N-acetyltransferase [Candidatus Woesearchaeota archaeon]|nr:GNAT family N-acetyltransferase [Candidatus Woesearchaeota archaeon]